MRKEERRREEERENERMGGNEREEKEGKGQKGNSFGKYTNRRVVILKFLRNPKRQKPV